MSSSSLASVAENRPPKRRRDSESSDGSAVSLEDLQTGPAASSASQTEPEDDFLGFSSSSLSGSRSGGGGVGAENEGTEDPPWFDDETPWTPASAPLVGLHNEILRFCDLVSPSPGECHARTCALDDVKGVLSKLWPECQVKVFGSELTGLALPASDLDIACLGVPSFGGGGGGRQQNNNGSSPLRRFADALRTAGLVSQLEVVPISI